MVSNIFVLITYLVWSYILCFVNSQLVNNNYSAIAFSHSSEAGKNTVLLGYITAFRDKKTGLDGIGRWISGAMTSAVLANKLQAPYKLGFIVKDTENMPDKSIRLTVDLSQDERVGVIIGPPDSCHTEAAIATAYNIPMITYACNDARIQNRNEFKTLIGTEPSPNGRAKTLVSLLRHYNWTKVAVVSPKSGEYNHIAAALLAEMRQHGIGIVDIQFFAAWEMHAKTIIDTYYKKARIFVVFGTFSDALTLLVAMENLGLLKTGEYFVIGNDYDFDRGASFYDKSIRNNNVKTVNILKSLLFITHQGQGDGMRSMQAKNRYYLSEPPFKIDSFSNLQNVFLQTTGYLYDAVVLYATAVNKILKTHPIGSIRNGTLVREMLQRHNYNSSIGFMNYINENGESEGNYTILSYQATKKHTGECGVPLDEDEDNIKCGMFPVAMFILNDNASVSYKLLDEDINWIGGKPPLAEPVCGFQNELCPPQYQLQIGLGVACGFVLVLCVVAIFIYRGRKFEQELDKLLWKIQFKDIQLIPDVRPLVSGKCNKQSLQINKELIQLSCVTTSGNHAPLSPSNTNLPDANTNVTTSIRPLQQQHSSGHGNHTDHNIGVLTKLRRANYKLSSSMKYLDDTDIKGLLLPALKSSMSLDCVDSEAQPYTLVGRYKTQIVAIKHVYKSEVNVSRKVKKELKILGDVNHQNLTKFLGACIDNPFISSVWEYCERGSLQDVLHNEDMTLESMFISSLVFDILRGLSFLHESMDFHYHGSLKSSNCVIDSRWILKLTDFGLTEFKLGVQLENFNDDYYFGKLFWTAPEILRQMSCRKPIYGPLCYNKMYDLLSERSDLNTNNRFSTAVITKDAVSVELVPSNGVHASKSSSQVLDVTAHQRDDVYAFGVIMYEMHSRKFPYESSHHSPKEIIRRVSVVNDEFHIPYRPKISELSTIDKYITDCIQACWNENPTLRPTVRQIIQRLKPMQSDKSANIFDNMMTLMETYAKNLERLVVERTGQLFEEKKRTEQLLYQMLPVAVAEQLKRGKHVEAEAFDAVTIYFSDIVGFTEMSADSTPFQVVHFLNDLYTTFDCIIAAYDVYKVETIGDAYMVVSGLPERNDYHAGEIATMSLHLLHTITSGFIIAHRPNQSLKLRIGIHTGPCCSGVVGTRMPRYCLFGDTVNTASRMESTGEACKIHISEKCKLALDILGGYCVQDRGEINVKGKGCIRTFWLMGCARENYSYKSNLSNS